MGAPVFLVVLGMWCLCQTVPLSLPGKKLVGFISSLCPVGAPGHRRAGAADGATDFRADHLLLLCRLYSPVPDSGCPAMADIVEALLAM